MLGYILVKRKTVRFIKVDIIAPSLVWHKDLIGEYFVCEGYNTKKEWEMFSDRSCDYRIIGNLSRKARKELKEKILKEDLIRKIIE